MKQLKKFVVRIPLAGHALADSQDDQSRKDVAAYWTSLSLWKISPGFERSRCTAIASAARIPRCFFALPQPKGKVLWRTSQKIREDLYALDGLWQYDWKDGFASSTAVLSSKWAPVIAYLKTLVTEIL